MLSLYLLIKIFKTVIIHNYFFKTDVQNNRMYENVKQH